MKYEKKHIPVEPDTHARFKVAAAQAGMKYDEYIKYLLNLGAAYPPKQTTKKASNV